MKIDKMLESTICHEWGHALIIFLLYGMDSLETIEIIDSPEKVDGHTTWSIFEDVSFENRIFIYFGGIAAERICGYSNVLLHKGTDERALSNMLPHKQQRIEYAEKVIKMLEPYKAAIEWLTKKTIEQLPGRDDKYCIYHRIFRDELKQLLIEAIKVNADRRADV